MGWQLVELGTEPGHLGVVQVGEGPADEELQVGIDTGTGTADGLGLPPPRQRASHAAPPARQEPST